ncbi:MAG: uroporphyrinogen-III synthase [Acidimicrobiia bacterium]
MRVAITTDRFDRISDLYRSTGLDPVWLPCIRVEPAPDEVLARAREATAEAGVLVLASARTVDLLWPQAPMPSIDVVAVGTATENAVTKKGGRVTVRGSQGLEALAVKARTQLEHAKVVFPRSADSDPAALRVIRSLAPDLLELEVYRTQLVAPQKNWVEAVAFASPSAVEGWHLTRDIDELVVGVIGATTWAAAARYREPDVVASIPSHRALAQALASHMEVKV